MDHEQIAKLTAEYTAKAKKYIETALVLGRASRKDSYLGAANWFGIGLLAALPHAREWWFWGLLVVFIILTLTLAYARACAIFFFQHDRTQIPKLALSYLMGAGVGLVAGVSFGMILPWLMSI